MILMSERKGRRKAKQKERRRYWRKHCSKRASACRTMIESECAKSSFVYGECRETCVSFLLYAACLEGWESPREWEGCPASPMWEQHHRAFSLKMPAIYIGGPMCLYSCLFTGVFHFASSHVQCTSPLSFGYSQALRLQHFLASACGQRRAITVPSAGYPHGMQYSTTLWSEEVLRASQSAHALPRTDSKSPLLKQADTTKKRIQSQKFPGRQSWASVPTSILHRQPTGDLWHTRYPVLPSVTFITLGVNAWVDRACQIIQNHLSRTNRML